MTIRFTNRFNTKLSMRELQYVWALVTLSATAVILAVAAWLTHVIYCFDHGLWGFLIAGALFFPVAIVHGIGLWFGAF